MKKRIPLFLIVVLVCACYMTANNFSIKAEENLRSAPVDWAFEESSVKLNDAIVLVYPAVDTNDDGFISISEANAMSSDLSLTYKEISGTLNGIEHFTSITKINLSNNQLSGEIPNELGNLNSLEILWLDNNNLSGEIPSELGDLSNLKELTSSSNKLSGEIPNELGNLSKLETLYLNANQLSGEIPSELGSLSNLKTLGLAYNRHIEGEIPSELGNLNKLVNLELNSNLLSGEIPNELGSLSNLKTLGLSDNQLTGEIPIELGNLNNLVDMYLTKNQLSEEIPSELGNLSALKNLWLSDNQLTGAIPSELGNLSNLKQLILNHNKLTEIPSELGNLSSLTALDLGYNKITGEIPSELENLNMLTTVYLSYNHLTSIKQSTFDFLTNLPTYSSVLRNQTYTTDLTELGTAGVDYEFDGLLAYEQFPNYGMTFTYTLHLPDESTITFSPTIDDGKVTILGSYLSQAGDYSLVAAGSGGLLNSVEYTTNFSVSVSVIESEEIDYISATANGVEDEEISTKIAIKLSKEFEVGELTINDITLASNTRTIISINKDSLTSLGDGEYELAISGTWDEGTNINVTLEKSGVVFSPATQSIILHTKLDSSGENSGNNGNSGNSSNDKINNNDKNDGNNGNSGSDNNNDKNDNEDKLPQTGYDTTGIILIFITGLLALGGYSFIRRTE